MTTPHLAPLLACACALTTGALALGACTSETDPDPGPAGPDEAEIMERTSAFETNGEFTRIDAEAFASQHATSTVSIWASADAVAMYRAIDPADTSATSDEFPVGAILIKEHLGPDGARGGYTVMAKGGVGGDPEAGDWWWGLFDATGTMQAGGALPTCVDCHRANGLERTDWVRGVATDNRAP